MTTILCNSYLDHIYFRLQLSKRAVAADLSVWVSICASLNTVCKCDSNLALCEGTDWTPGPTPNLPAGLHPTEVRATGAGQERMQGENIFLQCLSSLENIIIQGCSSAKHYRQNFTRTESDLRQNIAWATEMSETCTYNGARKPVGTNRSCCTYFPAAFPVPAESSWHTFRTAIDCPTISECP